MERSQSNVDRPMFTRTPLPTRFCNFDRLMQTLEARGIDGVVMSLSRASAELASYLEPREHGVSSSTSHLSEAIENLHASATALATFWRVNLAQAHRARLEALLGAVLPTSLMGT